MRRALLAALAATLLGAAAAALWMLRPVAPLEARFAHADCRRLAVTDAETGAPVVGIEDLAVAADGARIYLSAYDRLASAAYLAGEGPLRPGRIYRIPATALDARAVAAEGVGALAETGPWFWPHGFALIEGAEADEVVFVRRGAAGGADGRRARVQLARARFAHDAPPGAARVTDVATGGMELCQANDLAASEAGLVVAIDARPCGATDVLTRSGALARIDPAGGAEIVAEDLAFANGVAATSAGLAAAETRGGRVRLLEQGRAIPTPGGPDNLTVDADGALIAALHPRLPRLGLYRYGWTERAPSRVVRIDVRSGAVEALFDDPSGALFSGATVAAMAGERLVAGSVRDAGLLVCAPGGGGR